MHDKKSDLLWQTRIITKVYFFVVSSHTRTLIGLAALILAGPLPVIGYISVTTFVLVPKCQATVSRSSDEANYRVVAHVVAECSWLCQLLHELHRPLHTATLVFCDNISAVYMACNPVQHRRMKHIEIEIHFVHEKVYLGLTRVLHVPSSHQFPDIMTKGLPSSYSWTFGTFYASVHLTHWLRGDVKVHTLYSYILPPYLPNYTRL